MKRRTVLKGALVGAGVGLPTISIAAPTRPPTTGVWRFDMPEFRWVHMPHQMLQAEDYYVWADMSKHLGDDGYIVCRVTKTRVYPDGGGWLESIAVQNCRRVDPRKLHREAVREPVGWAVKEFPNCGVINPILDDMIEQLQVRIDRIENRLPFLLDS